MDGLKRNHTSRRTRNSGKRSVRGDLKNNGFKETTGLCEKVQGKKEFKQAVSSSLSLFLLYKTVEIWEGKILQESQDFAGLQVDHAMQKKLARILTTYR